MAERIALFDDLAVRAPAATEQARWRLAWRRPRLTLPRWIGLKWLAPVAVVAAMLICAIAPGLLAPFDPTDMGDAILSPPDAVHWFGTDHFGRDVLTLMIYGARSSLLMGACAVFVGGLIGALIGLVSGYAGRWIDSVLMRLLDIWMSVPDILLAIILAASLGASLTNTILAVGLVTVPRYARVMRAQVLTVRGRSYVEAARANGCAEIWIVVRHILPHTVSPMLVMATLGVGSSILIGASLSFIGLGVIDDRPDWGFLLSQGRSYLTAAWWFATLPGLAITALVISVNMLGDAIRDRFDPRLGAS